MSWYFLEFYISGTTHHVHAFPRPASSVQRDYSRFIHVFECTVSLSPSIAELYGTEKRGYSLFTHSPVDGHSGGFQFLGFVNKAAMNICLQVISCPLLLGKNQVR